MSVTDDKRGELLHKKKTEPVSFKTESEKNYQNKFYNSLLIGNRQEILEIESVLIRIVVEYEKRTITTVAYRSVQNTLRYVKMYCCLASSPCCLFSRLFL